MLLQIPDLFTAQEVRDIRGQLDAADWVDGKVTAGHQSTQVKHNSQLPETATAAVDVGKLILRQLQQNRLFMAAALPHSVFPPLFNRYSGGEHFGNHVDNAIRYTASGLRIRTDLSATLFLSAPDEYDGGELLIDDTYGSHSVKLPAGSLVLYPSTSLHRVNPVTRGARVASFFWIQSMIKDDAQRTLLFDLDMSIQKLRNDVGDNDAIVTQTGIYHNLLRQWAEV